MQMEILIFRKHYPIGEHQYKLKYKHEFVGTNYTNYLLHWNCFPKKTVRGLSGY